MDTRKLRKAILDNLDGVSITSDFGCMIEKDGAVYFGYLTNGKKHGRGIWISEDHLLKQGSWNNDHFQFALNLENDRNFNNKLVDFLRKSESKKNQKSQSWENFVSKIKEEADIPFVTERRIGDKIYTGSLKNGKPHGKGIATWDSGKRYEGNFADGWCHGQGKFYSDDGTFYEGTWKTGARDGQFKVTSKEGNVSNITYSNGKLVSDTPPKKSNDDPIQAPTSVSEESQEEHTIYEGGFLDGQKHGEGKLITKKDDIILKTVAGIWRHNKFVYRTVYEGEYADNKRHGKGKLLFYQGDELSMTVYTTWTSGIADYNHCTIKYVDGVKYTGSIEKAFLRNGIGTMIWPNGDRFEGDWKDGYRKGKGVYVWPTGSYYDGDWQKNKRSGHGKLMYPDGALYEGKWKDGKYDGKGKLTIPITIELPDGLVIPTNQVSSVQEGTWQEGKFVR